MYMHLDEVAACQPCQGPDDLAGHAPCRVASHGHLEVHVYVCIYIYIYIYIYTRYNTTIGWEQRDNISTDSE